MDFRKRRSRKVGRKTRKGTKKGMRRKTARRAYKKLRGGQPSASQIVNSTGRYSMLGEPGLFI